jgi:hypothetical protein
VLGIDQHSEYINVALETVEGRYPDGKKDFLLINARECELVEKLGNSHVEIDVDTALHESGSGVLEKRSSGILKKGK